MSINAFSQEELEQSDIANDDEQVEGVVFNGKNMELFKSPASSIFYNQEEINALHGSLIENKKSKLDKLIDIDTSDSEPIEIVTDNNSTPEVGETKSYNSPSFYLATILYQNKKVWTFWLNDKKIRKENSSNLDFKVKEIASNYIIFTFETDKVDILSPNYMAALQPLEENDPLVLGDNSGWDYASKKRDILLDSTRGIFQFKIGINQSFSVFDAKIFEGRKGSNIVSVKYSEDGSYRVMQSGGKSTEESEPGSEFDI